jgi:hypothetical protein
MGLKAKKILAERPGFFLTSKARGESRKLASRPQSLLLSRAFYSHKAPV